MLARVVMMVLAMISLGAAKTWLVAVEDLTAQGVSGSDASILSDRLRADLLNTNVFRVMERGQMDKVLKEQAFEASGACEGGQCAVQLGRLLSVDRLVVGSVGRIGTVYTLQVRLLDVTTGEVVASATEDRSGAIDGLLTKSIPAIAKKLAAVQEEGARSTEVATSPKIPPRKDLSSKPQGPKESARPHWFRWGALAAAVGAGSAATVFHLQAQRHKRAASDALDQYKVATSGFEALKATHAQEVRDANWATTTAVSCDVAAGALLGAFSLTYAF